MFTINSVIDYFFLGDTKIEHKLALGGWHSANALALIFLKPLTRNHLYNMANWVFV